MATAIPERWPPPGPRRRGRAGTLLGSVSIHAIVFAAIVLAPLLAAAMGEGQADAQAAEAALGRLGLIPSPRTQS